MHPRRPRLWRLTALSVAALALTALAASAPTASALAQTPTPPTPAAKPATPVVNAPQKPTAQRPPPAKPAQASPTTPLPAPPVPPATIPAEPAAQPAAPAGEPAKGASTGHPLPRYAALRSDEVNFRVGPGTRYPIEWTYKRRDLPVLIEREFEVWRLVRDPEGARGWVHVSNLTTRRSFVVTGAERVLRRSAAEDSREVARLQAGVIGHIRGCKAGAEWCQMQVGEYRGWLKRADFWGTLPGEAVN